MNNENFDLVTNDENEEFTVEFGEVINDGGTHDYNELDNQPQINGHTLEGNKTNEQLGIPVYSAGENITISDDYVISATGGGGGTSDYEDLSNLPKLNNVTLKGNKSLSDLGIQPAGDYALESEIPDVSNFITKSVDDLVNYYKKSETFTKQEVNNLISAITTLDIRVVQTLPTEDISTTTIYLVPKTTAGTNDVYDEYVYVSNAWEHIGSTDIDLSGYQTKIDSSHKLSSDLVDDANQTNKFVTTSEKQTWNNKLDQSDLTNYVTFDDYATSTTAGVVITNSQYGVSTSSYTKNITAVTKTYAQYQDGNNAMFVGKGTLENVIAGKGLVTNQDISGKVNTSQVKNTMSTTAGDVYDVRYINNMIGDVEIILTRLTTGSGV